MPAIILPNRYQNYRYPPMSASINPAHGVSRGMVLCYLFNEGNGNVMNNLASYNFAGGSQLGKQRGTIVGPDWSKHIYKHGLYFHGGTTTDRVVVGSAIAHPASTQSFSFYWRGVIFSQGGGSAGRFFRSEASSGGTIGLDLQIQNTMAMELRVPGTTAMVVITNDNMLKLNTEHTVIVTKPNALTAGDAHIYVDGVECTYLTQTNGATATLIRAELHLGNRSNAGAFDRAFDGVWYQTMFWNRVLKLPEIIRLSQEPYYFLNLGKRVRLFNIPVAIDNKTASLTKALISIVPNTSTASKNINKTSSPAKSLVSIIANAVSASKNVNKTASPAISYIRLQANSTTASTGAVTSFTASTTKVFVSVLTNNLSVSKGINKTASVTKSLIFVNANNLSSSKGVNKTSSTVKAFVNIIANTITVSKGVNKSASLITAVITIKANDVVVSKVIIKSANLTKESIRLIINSITASIPSPATTLEATILLQSAIETRLNLKSALETRLLLQSQAEKQLYNKSRISKHIIEESAIEKSILLESKVDND